MLTHTFWLNDYYCCVVYVHIYSAYNDGVEEGVDVDDDADAERIEVRAYVGPVLCG